MYLHPLEHHANQNGVVGLNAVKELAVSVVFHVVADPDAAFAAERRTAMRDRRARVNLLRTHT